MKSQPERAQSELEHAREGELITRADGSQVLKVKKRKRRSKPTLKNPVDKQDPFIKWFTISLLLALIIIPVIGSIFIIANYNGKGFKEQTESNIKNIASAEEATLKAIKVTPLAFSANSANVSWSDQSFLNNASFKKIEAKLQPSTFISKNWIGEDVIAEKGQIYLQNPTTYINQNRTDDPPPESPYRFNVLSCQKLDVYFGNPKNKTAIKNLLATFRKSNNGELKSIFQNGLAEVPSWPDILISSAIISHQQNKIEVNALIEAHQGTGKIEIKGAIKKSVTQAANLSVQVSQFPIQEILNEELAKIFHGPINSTEAKFIYDFSETGLRIEIPFQSKSIEMAQLPMFTVISELTDKRDYKNPIFNHCSGTLILTPDNVQFKDLELISNQLMTIHGDFSANANGKMSGNIQVAIPTDAIIRNANSPFSDSADGYHSTAVTISGNIHSPHDNLKEKLKLHQRQPASKTPALREKSYESKLFDSLTR